LDEVLFNKIRNSLLANSSDGPVVYLGLANNNEIVDSTMTCSALSPGVYFNYSSNNNVLRSAVYNQSGSAMRLENSSDYNAVVESRLISSGAGGATLSMSGANNNTLMASYLTSSNGSGLDLSAGGSNENRVYYSTITGDGNFGVYIDYGVNNLFGDCYIRGSTAAYINDADGTVINSSVFVATNSFGHAVRLSGGSSGFSMSSSTLSGGAQGAAVWLDTGSAGALELSTNVVAGGFFGLAYGTPGAGASLSVSSLTFTSLSAGGTAVKFFGGQVVSTFNGVAFAAENISVNIDASALAEGSTVYVLRPSGTKAWQHQAADPARRIHWPWPAYSYVYHVAADSVTVAYGENGADAYGIEVANNSNFDEATGAVGAPGSGLVAKGGLGDDTTYYLRALAQWDQAQYYSPAAVLSTATLALPPANAALAGIYYSSAAAAWDLVTSQGYRLEASTAADFTGVLRSSSSEGLQAAGLAVDGLDANTTYYFRAASLNWNGEPNYAAAGSSATLSNPDIGAQVAACISRAWV